MHNTLIEFKRQFKFDILRFIEHYNESKVLY